MCFDTTGVFEGSSEVYWGGLARTGHPIEAKEFVRINTTPRDDILSRQMNTCRCEILVVNL